ncbi:hypothetical protein [Nocardia sp. NPDC052566]|uniref:hypothetical protein n=1 Tax=Nocardia sp. NPDC052566 TaxID=3364330 RepID=UPI0037C5ED68
MASKIEISPARLLGAAGEMEMLQVKVDGILAKLEASLRARGEAWGDDSYGNTFAAGDNGYVKARANLTEGMGNVAKTLGSYASGQRKTARMFKDQDHM